MFGEEGGGGHSVFEKQNVSSSALDPRKASITFQDSIRSSHYLGTGFVEETVFSFPLA